MVENTFIFNENFHRHQEIVIINVIICLILCNFVSLFFIFSTQSNHLNLYHIDIDLRFDKVISIFINLKRFDLFDFSIYITNENKLLFFQNTITIDIFLSYVKYLIWNYDLFPFC